MLKLDIIIYKVISSSYNGWLTTKPRKCRHSRLWYTMKTMLELERSVSMDIKENRRFTKEDSAGAALLTEGSRHTQLLLLQTET